MFDKEGNLEVPYKKDDVYNAIVESIPRIKGMNITKSDKMRGYFQINSGMTLFSWGENLEITLKDSLGGTIISVSSSNKIILDIYGKNKRNIEIIYQNISESLSKYPTIDVNQHTIPHTEYSNLEPIKRMEQIKNMLDNNLISQEEYDMKKQEILKHL